MESKYSYETFVRRVKKYAIPNFAGCEDPIKCIEEAVEDNQDVLRGQYKDLLNEYGSQSVTANDFKHHCKTTAYLLRLVW